MAEDKLPSPGFKPSAEGSSVPTGPGMATAMVPLEVALSGSIGARVRITTAQPTVTTIEGTLFTACPITNLIAINTATNTPANAKQSQSNDYHVVPISRIQSFQLLALAPSFHSSDGPSFADALPAIHALDTRALKAREAAAIAKAYENEARRGKGVTREAQTLFDAFSRTMPARWDKASIVVADAVTIAPPYHVDDCRPLVAGDTAALNRVRKVLEMERKKIELRSASATFGTAGPFSRTPASGASRDRIPNNPTPPPAQRKGG